jgi:RecA/RadA recombinase
MPKTMPPKPPVAPSKAAKPKPSVREASAEVEQGGKRRRVQAEVNEAPTAKPARSRRALESDAEDGVIEQAPSVITASRTGLVKVPAILLSSAFAELSAMVDKVEAHTEIATSTLSTSSFVKNAIASGCLMYDFVSGGGVAPGRFTIVPGREGSGKSTLVNYLASTCVLQGTPIYWFDAESALSPDYVSKIFSKFGLRFGELLGVRDMKNKARWEVPPIIRYSDDSIGEHVFKTMHGMLKLLPTVRQDSNGNWWKLMVGKTKKEWVEDEREGRPQYLFIVDSWPALLPESIDENPDKSPMAVQARMFSDNIKLVKALLGQKNCVLFSTNQLRLNPGARMQDPVYEPGGEALKFYSDNRTRIMRVSPNTAGVPSGAGAKFSEEPGLNGGVDRFVYAKVQNTKNKAFAPFRESTFRIRFLKDGAPGDGICESWDCASYLQATGQMLQRGNTMTMHVRPAKDKGKDNPIFEEGQRISRAQFKELVEAPRFKRAVYMHCLRQIRAGYAFQLERESMSRLIAAGGEESAAVSDDSGVEA